MYKKLRVYIMAINAAQGAFYFGYNLGVFNVLQKFVKDNVYPDVNNIVFYLMSAFITIGAAFGAAASPMVVLYFGTRKSLIFTDFIGTIGTIVMVLPNQYCLLVGRFIAGLCLGLNASLSQVYINEIAPPSERGAISGIFQNALATGLIVAFLLGLGIPTGSSNPDSKYWIFMLSWNFITIGIRTLLLLIVYKLDTPKSYLLKKNREKAIESLKNIYGEENYEERKYTQLEAEVKAEAEEIDGEKYKKLCIEPLRPRFLICVVLAFLLQATGITVIELYSNDIFLASTNNDEQLATVYSLIFAVMGLVGSGISLLFVNKVGRRPIQLWGLVTQTAVIIIFGIIATINGPGDPSLKYLIFLFHILFSGLISQVYFTYLPEILPSYSIGLIVIIQWVSGFLCAFFYPILRDIIGVGPTFLIMGAFGVIGLLICLKWFQETKGKTKLEIRRSFSLKEVHPINQKKIKTTLATEEDEENNQIELVRNNDTPMTVDRHVTPADSANKETENLIKAKAEAE